MINLVSGVPGIVAEVASAAAQAGGVAGAASGGRATQASFFDVFQQMGTQVIDNMQAAEKQSFKAVMGEANTREVVDALMTADQSLQTAIAIRDKLVTAYLDITRMQI